MAEKWDLRRDPGRVQDQVLDGDSAGQSSQLITPGLTLQIATLLIPGTQHDALDRFALHQRIVYGGPVGVAVDDAADAPSLESRRHSGGIDIHDLRDGACGMSAAAGAHPIGKQLSVRERQSEE